MSRETKQSIRERIAQQRCQLSLTERQEKAEGLLTTLANRPEFQTSQRIAAYWPVQGEIDPLPLVKLAFQLNKRCYLPVLQPGQEKQLLFYEYHLKDRLTPNRYGIPEPSTAQRRPIAVSRLNLVLVPLLAFSEQGQRLGRGGGYYDSSFAFLKENPRSRQLKLIGLAYEFQKMASLPQAEWDIPLCGIATEKRFIISRSVP